MEFTVLGAKLNVPNGSVCTSPNTVMRKLLPTSKYPCIMLENWGKLLTDFIRHFKIGNSEQKQQHRETSLCCTSMNVYKCCFTRVACSNGNASCLKAGQPSRYPCHPKSNSLSLTPSILHLPLAQRETKK